MVQATGTFVKPITDAFVLEGSYHIKPPCYSNPRTDKCLYGSPWVQQVAQIYMGGPKAANITWEVTNSFHPVWKIPFVRGWWAVRDVACGGLTRHRSSFVRRPATAPAQDLQQLH